MVIANSITDLIGGTPLLRINGLTGPCDAEVIVKLESFNAGGSIKDRIAKYLIEYAEAAGSLDKDKTILEATSGNTGIALAMIAAAKGYKITIVMSKRTSEERRKLIRAYGADLVLSPAERGTGGAIEMKRSLLEENPEKYIDINQFRDPANILAHYQTTGQEIIKQTGGDFNMVVTGIGTGGTGAGISLRVKGFKRSIQVIGVTSKKGSSIPGLRNPNEPNPTQLFRPEGFDEIVSLSDDDHPAVKAVARGAAKEEGLLVGMSAAAILHIALQKAKSLGKGKKIVAILPDDGMKYLSTDFYSSNLPQSN
ncbi:MAG: PLP-dependent cysteine synthase family protein [Candidatus Bathyarchaeota archaeon]|jgi:cysteine synthase|nr:PLP-dependent cysteine synthase family protein [Candidatus Bathyarchaeota archaeon]|tara:strand:+ start:6637 stop:7566 length:930 start_codon:yes stop_codon:yes gene_type:complete